jgi:hypothetical protein
MDAAGCAAHTRQGSLKKQSPHLLPVMRCTQAFAKKMRVFAAIAAKGARKSGGSRHFTVRLSLPCRWACIAYV